jgi:hypothetical protein
MRVSCLYAIVRFVPYAETSEFANVGIVLCVPELHYFNFKLAPAKFKRIPAFFEDLNSKLFGAAKENLENDLLRVNNYSQSINPEQLVYNFKDIVRSRENIIRFGELRSALIDISPDEYLDALYKKFVGRDFITSERHSQEANMVKTIRDSFKSKHLPIYKEAKIVSELIEAKFPLVNKDHDDKVIKPLAFQQGTPTKVIEHGERWYWKINRLTQAGSLLSQNILLPFEAPKTNDRLLTKAFDEVVAGFRHLNVEVCDFNDDDALINFARREFQPEEFKLV